MAQIGTKLRAASGSNGYRALMHWCPGCNKVHGCKIGGDGPTKWTFNGDYNVPSFSPSMLIRTNHDGEKRSPDGQMRTVCHYFIKTGAELQNREPGRAFDPAKSYIDFCGDSPHALSGKVVELPDWPYAPGSYGGIDE